MKFTTLSAVLLASVISTSALAADGHFDRTLPVAPGLKLNVATGAGYIHVTPGNDRQIHIAAQIHANHSWLGLGNGDLDSRIKQIEANPPIQQSGNEITVGPPSHQREGLYRDIGIDYEIQAPHGTVLLALTGSGDIQAEDPGANSAMTTGSGSVRVNNLHGGASFQTGSGDIQVQQASSGDVKATTGSGSIRINGFTGGLSAKSGSGDIQVEGHATSDWHLQTGSGSIRLGIGNDAHVTLDASTGSGTVHTSQPITMQGSMDRHRVHGNINGGGPVIRAATGSGDVEIH